MNSHFVYFSFFFFNDTATTEIYTLSLHDALPISSTMPSTPREMAFSTSCTCWRSEEHTSELQSHVNLVCRLLLEKKKKKNCKDYMTNEKNTNKQNLNGTESQ